MANTRPLHERVYGHVKVAGLTIAQVAEKTGWHRQRAYRVLTGKTDITGEDIELLASILGKQSGELYVDIEGPAAEEKAS
jgi:transcriptional regulator with XRE-family HTH domain